MIGLRVALIVLLAAAAVQPAVAKPGGGGGGKPSGSTPPNPQVAYVSLSGKEYQLIVANEDGTNATKLYGSRNPFRFDLAPRAQQKIAINERGTVKLLTYRATASGAFEAVTVDSLHEQDRVSNFVDFSPDGSKIAFQGSGGGELMVYDLATDTATEWATGNYIFDMSWYDDGSTLAFIDAASTSDDRILAVTAPGATPELVLQEQQIWMIDSARTKDQALVVSYEQGGSNFVGLWNNGSYDDPDLPGSSSANKGTLSCDDSKLAYSAVDSRGRAAWYIRDMRSGLQSSFSPSGNINWVQFWPTC